MFVGLMLAWHEELAGGLVAMGSWAGFHMIYGWALRGSAWQGWPMILFVVPGLLFVACGATRRRAGSAAVR
jgi:hypothetical protein